MVDLLLLLAVFLVLLASGVPVAFAIGAASTVMLILDGGSPMTIARQTFSGVNSFILVAVPMFVFAGELLLRSGMTRSLTDLADLLVGRTRGGLGHTNVVASVFFSGVTGSATADTTAIGSVMIPAMAEKGYGRAYSAALTVASSVIGAILPPSLTFVIYALAVGDVSIGGLFAAGLVPGILTALALMLMNWYVSHRRGYPKREHRYTLSHAFTTIRRALVVLVIPIVIAYGIISGAFTATEAAAVAAAYAVIIGLILRILHLDTLITAAYESAKTSSIMLLLLATSSLLSYVLVTQGAPELLSQGFAVIADNWVVFLIFINIALLLIGTVVDLFPAILIFGPILAPIAAQYDIDPLHFGVVFCVNLLIGLNTPPVGSGLFIGSAIAKVPFEEIVKEVMPFVCIQVIVLLLISYIPSITVWLPRVFGY